VTTSPATPLAIELTASTILLRHSDGIWQAGLIHHERLGAVVPAGGHVEPGEGVLAAAMREVAEETGLRALPVPAPATPAPPGLLHPLVAALPWWTAEMPAASDHHTSQRHLHIDHLYLALVSPTTGTGTPAEHQLEWFSRSQINADPQVSPDTRAVALHVLSWLNDVPGSAATDPLLLAGHLHARAQKPL